jgi:hydrogenase maturation protease
MQLLPLVESASHLLVLDAIDAGQPPATVIELPGDAIPLMAGIKLSQHQVSFQEILGLAQVRSKLPPHLHLLGVQPADMSIGIELSPEVSSVVPDVVARALKMLKNWGVTSRT